ncbi:anthocyanidin 3-O-glucosyltransferase 6-like [Prosopis cineraria]|uniref:anthocyanidin 3-O-glucosyltransferase 6-like n=1 Tax=Prosopis cineraria TaxID=364024 RepID=UPI0024104B5F|nr:anthocyanidin 3-O-glucosyltransferase 6-like [Prosopis cineraria]
MKRHKKCQVKPRFNSIIYHSKIALITISSGDIVSLLSGMKKSQLVFVPASGMGHLVSAVELAKLLINRHDQLSVTVLITKAPSDPTFDAYTHSLTSSLSLPQRLHFVLLPPHPHRDHANSHSLHPTTFLESLIENQKLSVRNAVSKLVSDPGSPQLSGFVLDMFCAAMIDVAADFRVPAIIFFTSSAAFLGFKLHVHTLWERENVDTTALDFNDSATGFAIPSFANHVPASVFPGPWLDKDWAPFVLNLASWIKKTKRIIVNTFDELESHAIQSFSSSDLTVYPIGPILSIGDNQTVAQESGVIRWLDDQAPSSVIFLCFGSRGYLDQNQVTEMARALEASSVHFVWSLRKPPPKGWMEAPSDYSNVEEILPEGFLLRTAKLGRVMGWAPQAQILAHEAVGGFVSHCGWNSILESIYYGVPIATWPLHAEQQVNAFQLVRELKMSLEISLDYRSEFGNVGKSGVISAETIARGIKEVMEKESETRKKVKQMSELSRRALMEGGSSFSSLGRFIHDLLS